MADTPMADTSSRPARDLRLDFFRGLALFFIFIDHIPENVLAYFTLRSIAFNDAAEVFIFISGYTAALVYGRSLAEKGALFATAQVFRRVWQLYVAHIFLFVIFTAEVSYAIGVVQNPMYSEELGVADFLQEPHLAIIRALTLGFQPTFLDILPLYIVLLATFPLVLIVMARQPIVPLVVSGAIYVLTLRQGWAFHTRPSHAVWFFNPLAWQFLFVIGATCGYARVAGRWPFPRLQGMRPRWMSQPWMHQPWMSWPWMSWPWMSWPWMSWLAIALAGLIAIINFSWTLHWIFDPFPPLLAKQLWSYSLDKTNLAPLRLFSFLMLAVATVYLVKPEARFLRSFWARPVIICGQQSLYIFCIGILLSVLGHFILAERLGGIVMQFLVNLVGIIVMIVVGALLDWFKRVSRRPGRGTAAPLTAPLE